MRRWGWDKQLEAQDGLCWICLERMDLEPLQGDNSMSVDHIVPFSRGGANSWRNKLLAHQFCNSKRGSPFIWVPLNIFRRAAMKRVQAKGRIQTTTVDGVDLGCSYVHRTSAKTIRLKRRLATLPSRMASKALRVPLAELSSRSTRSGGGEHEG